MRKKSGSKKGFTLAELLIVVAIIAILVAIMIPVFTTSRGKAILSRDAANLRSIYAEAVTDVMSNETSDGAVLSIKFQKYINESDIKFSKTTKAAYTAPTASKNGQILITSTATDGKEIIVIDNDIKLVQDDGTTDQGTEITLPEE